MKWEEILANNVTNKELTSKIHKKLIQLKIGKKKKSKCLNQQMGRRPKQMLFHKHRQPTGTWKDA